MKRKVIFAGGGTAGHIEPALAVAREWQQRYPEDEITFLGTSSGLETTLVPAAGFKLHLIPKVAIARKLSPSLLRIPRALFASVEESKRAMDGASLVIGFGGYVSGPAYLAARSHRVPLVIHEANAIPGWANRMGSYFTPYLAITQDVEGTRFDDALITGIPLRSDVQQVLLNQQPDWTRLRREAKASLNVSPDEKLVVIMGGSQGSLALNKVVTQAVADGTLDSVRVLHSVGARNELGESNAKYTPVHYIEQMANAYLAADLLIARSGAITCSEINALGKYALFIPLPVGNGEQEFNARYLIEQGRAEVLEQSQFTPGWLASHLPELLETSSKKSDEGSLHDRDASAKIANLMEYALGLHR